MTAVERGLDMMRLPFKSIPPLAMGYLQHLSKQVGLCGEVYLTAWCHYAQEVEGLSCDDSLYQSTQDAAEWFAENLNKGWKWTTLPDGRIRPECE